jgi:hypothetical protein
MPNFVVIASANTILKRTRGASESPGQSAYFNASTSRGFIMSAYENEITPDEWLVSDINANADDEPTYYERRLRKKYDKVKSEANSIDGLSIKAPDFATLISTKKREKSRAISFTLELKKSELVLTAGTPGGSRFILGKKSVPTDLDEYRTFLEGLMNWSDGDHPLVTEADFKDWSKKNPKKPTVYKTYEEMVKKSKADAEAFRTWAKTNAAGKKALDELTKTDKLKPTDAARVKALKAVDAVLPAYYKTF